MDRPEVEEQAQAVEQDDAAVSEPRQESESGWMNRAIRAVGGWLSNPEPDSADQEQPRAESEATTPEVPTADVDIERRVQSEVDRREAKRTWETAVKAIEEGDPGPMAELAARGDQRAERELSRRGMTYELGEARGKAVQSQEQNNAERERIAVIAGGFDEALLKPVLDALPEKERDEILGEGLAGLDGRKDAVTKALGALVKITRRETATKLLGDEKFARELLGDTTFRRELLKNPVMNKQLRSFFRGELDQPDLNPGSGPGARTEGENAEMNEAFRNAYAGAVERGEDERGASTRTGSARRGNADLLDDDE